MSYLDTYYRALIDYRKNTTADKDCGTQRSTTAKTNPKGDSVTVVRRVCDIETDWIEAIEEGLVHVDKAIREERQFIRSNGEVIDIEKVKNVSKDSVEHLARHSNLITKFEEDKDIVPDRLYTVERLSDYAVYENRFLYMLLCYLRDFITLRYNKILDVEHTYSGSMEMNKSITMSKRKLSVELKLDEQIKDDEFLKQRSKSHTVIGRIKDILELVHSYLSTPLMEEVGKVPMLKPPVTKTNVLRMNHNFRGALALYEYISAYDRDGYTVREEVQKINPFRLDMADEFSEIILMASFLTYEYGLNVNDVLREEYEEEERRRKEAEKERLGEQIKALRSRIRESGESPEEYMLLLEKRNRLLEQDSIDLKKTRADLAAKLQEIKDLNSQIEAMNVAFREERERLVAEQDAIRAEGERRLTERTAEYEQRITGIRTAHGEEIARLNDEHTQELTAQQEAYEDEISSLKAEHETTVASMQELMDGIQSQLDSERAGREEIISGIREQLEKEKNAVITECNDAKAACRKDAEEQRKSAAEVKANAERTVAEIKAENERLVKARRLSDARLIALRKEHGLLTELDDFTTEAAFKELEHQCELFNSFFNSTWRKTKKVIRKDEFLAFVKSLKEERQEKKDKKQGKGGDTEPDGQNKTEQNEE